MANISEFSENEEYKVSFNTLSGEIEIKNIIDKTWISGVIPEESISVVAPLVVPGFSNGDMLYAIGYYIASKISGGSSAK